VDRCPYCRSDIDQLPEEVACSDCGSRYHNDCWRMNKGCSILGCNGRMISLADGGRTRVFSAPLLPTVQNVKNLLELRGIAATILNQYLNAALGGIPPMECWPELWVSDADAAQAKQIVNSLLADSSPSVSDWTCPQCNEQLEGQFTECWNCDTERNS
jgi:hypothetical protein